MSYYYKGSLRFSSHDQIANYIISHNLNKVLDIGCNKGFIGQALREKGWRGYVVGIDKNRSYKRIILQKKYNKFLAIDIERIPINLKEKFEAIVLADVLEHLTNPLQALIAVKNKIGRNGIFIISVPNIANFFIRFHLLLGNFNYLDYGILDKDHRYFYTYKTAKKLVRQAGLKLVLESSTPIPTPFLSNHLLLKKLLYLIYKLAKGLLVIRKEFFAYQFIFICKKV